MESTILGTAFAAFALWLALRIGSRLDRGEKLSDRLLVSAAATVGGASCAFLVMIGKWCEWLGFSVGSGYWGTHFLDSMLYAIGNSDEAVRVVAVVWFIYGAGISGGAAVLGLKMFARNRHLPSTGSRPEEVASEMPCQTADRPASNPDSEAK